MPAVYSSETVALGKAEGSSDEAFAEYLSAITTVTVNGTDYKASGKGSVVIINTETGKIDLDASNGSVFSENGTYSVIVNATGYNNLEFEVNVDRSGYVLMNIPCGIDCYHASCHKSGSWGNS